MAFFKRIFFFGLVNIAVMVTITMIVSLLGIDTRYLTPNGLNIQALIVFCLLWGMAGSFISLAISRWMAKMTMGVQVIQPENATGSQRLLMEKVHQLARKAGISKMPEVGIYDSPEVNAFATGPTRNRSLVAVSTGLLHRMDVDEVEGVLAHEVAHIANGDMVTMTLIQGVVNAFVMFLARVISFAIFSARSGDDRESSGSGNSLAQMLVTMALEIVIGLFGTMVVAAFSRWREYRADAGAAKLGGKAKMIAALQRLQNYKELADVQGGGSLAAFKISSKKGGFLSLFSTHPDLEDRINRLKMAN